MIINKRRDEMKKPFNELKQKQDEIIKKLERLSKFYGKAQSDLEEDIYKYGEAEVHYGHLGDAERINHLLQEINDIVFQG